jgi:predicted RNA-binding Zn ribbon-like protein
MADGSWQRLKACKSDTCRWAFIDHARNRSRQWCDMAVCGNREKARTFRKKSA